MHTRYKLLCFILTIITFCCCSKDKGSYSYNAGEVITVTGLNSLYTKMSFTDTLLINPTVASSVPDADFEYFWGIYLDKTTPIDTIGKTKQLNFPVKKNPGIWTLIFSAKNKKTGYAQLSITTVNIGTLFTCGWYVAKDDGSNTDVDLFTASDTIIPRNKIDNVFSAINGRKLNGKAQMFNYFSSYRDPAFVDAKGNLVSTKVLFVVSDKDASTAYINTFKEVKSFSQMFYEPPATQAPYFVSTTQQINSFVNDGQLYCILYAGSNTGRYGIRILKDDNDSPYKLSKYFMSFYGPANLNTYLFDDMGSAFYSVANGGNKLGAITANAASKMSIKSNNKTVVFMGCKSASAITGYALFQDKTDPTLKTLATISPSTTVFNVTSIDTIKATDPLYSATNYALLQDDEEMLYFVFGNSVYSRNLNSKTNQLQYTVPDGETITFIRHRKFTGTGVDARYSYNYVMIGTKTSNGAYKVRMFPKAVGNLVNTTSPVITLEGTGSVGDVIFVSPTMTSGTYPSTY